MLSGAKCSRNIYVRQHRIKASPIGQFPRKTGEMSEMLSALNDKRGAPRVSGAVNGKEPLTEEDKKTVDMKTTILILSRQLR